jgi:hypothetical protein
MRVRGKLLCKRVVVRGKEKTAPHPFHEVAKYLRCIVQCTRCSQIMRIHALYVQTEGKSLVAALM